MLGEVGPSRLHLSAVARFANGPVRTPDGLHWDVLDLYRQSLDGLRAAAAARPRRAGAASASTRGRWTTACCGAGALLGLPFHYRDEARGAAGPGLVHDRVAASELYARTGLQFLPFNTVYQLAADDWTGAGRPAAARPRPARRHWLTGAEVAERTNASTTGLLSVATRRVGRRSLIGPRPAARALPRRWSIPARGSARCCRRSARRSAPRPARRRRRVARHRVGRGRHSPRRARLGVPLPRHLGPGRRRGRRRPC